MHPMFRRTFSFCFTHFSVFKLCTHIKLLLTTTSFYISQTCFKGLNLILGVKKWEFIRSVLIGKPTKGKVEDWCSSIFSWETKIVNYSTQLTTRHETGLKSLLCLKPDKTNYLDELTDSWKTHENTNTARPRDHKASTTRPPRTGGDQKKPLKHGGSGSRARWSVHKAPHPLMAS